MHWIIPSIGALLLAGCVTVQDSKSLVIDPSPTPTVVTAKAIAHCQDFFFVVSCDLQVWQEKNPSPESRGW
jgi:hypothetical protein